MHFFARQKKIHSFVVQLFVFRFVPFSESLCVFDSLVKFSLSLFSQKLFVVNSRCEFVKNYGKKFPGKHTHTHILSLSLSLSTLVIWNQVRWTKQILVLIYGEIWIALEQKCDTCSQFYVAPKSKFEWKFMLLIRILWISMN